MRKDQVTYVRQAATGGMVGAGLCMLLELHIESVDGPSAVRVGVAVLMIAVLYVGATALRRKGRG